MAAPFSNLLLQNRIKVLSKTSFRWIVATMDDDNSSSSSGSKFTSPIATFPKDIDIVFNLLHQIIA